METKKYTIKDIARKAGVSAGTVDRVLHQRGDVSEKSRQKVQQVLDEINYQPNKFAIGLAAKKSYRIVCILPQGFEGDYWSSVKAGIDRAAREMLDFNVNVELLPYRHADEANYREVCQQMTHEEADALLIAPNFRESTLELTRHLDAQQIPYLFVDYNVKEAHPISYIGQESWQSGYLAAKVLMREYQEGDELILFMTGSKESPAEIQMQRRLEGFTTYLSEHYGQLPIYDIVLDKENEAYNQQVLNDLFNRHPKVALGAAFNSRVHIVGRYLERSGQHLRSILGYDLLPKNVSCLKQGTVEYLIGQRPGLQGYYGILALCDHMVFKQPVPPLKYMPIDLLMKENIDYYFEMHT